jgi:integral membrane sensor domain MASE1
MRRFVKTMTEVLRRQLKEPKLWVNYRIFCIVSFIVNVLGHILLQYPLVFIFLPLVLMCVFEVIAFFAIFHSITNEETDYFIDNNI